MKLYKLITCVALCLAFIGASVASAQDAENERAELKVRLKVLEASLAAAVAKIRKLQTEVLELSAENVNLRRLLARSRRQPDPVLHPVVKPERVPAKSEKTRKALTATPDALTRAVLAKADALGLTTGKISEDRMNSAQAKLDEWARGEKLIGRKVTWAVKLIGADDEYAEQYAGLLTDRLVQDRLDLVKAQTQLDTILLGKADPTVFRELGRKETTAKLRERIAALEKSVPELTLKLWDAKIYTIKVHASAGDRDAITIFADVHKNDRLALTRLKPKDLIILSGTLQRIRCQFSEHGKAVFPIELGRCRLSGD